MNPPVGGFMGLIIFPVIPLHLCLLGTHVSQGAMSITEILLSSLSRLKAETP